MGPTSYQLKETQSRIAQPYKVCKKFVFADSLYFFPITPFNNFQQFIEAIAIYIWADGHDYTFTEHF